MAKALTAVAVEQAKAAPAAKHAREVPDGRMPGLYLVIYPSGKKGWAVRYRVAGKPRKLTLEPYPVLELAAAREKARDALLLAAKGIDPAAEKQSAKRAARQQGPDLDLFKSVASEFLQRHASKNRSAAETERLFEREVLPWWGDKRVRTFPSGT